MTTTTWTGTEALEVLRAVSIMRNALLEARAQLTVIGPLIARMCPDDVLLMRAAMIDADTALLRIKVQLDKVRR